MTKNGNGTKLDDNSSPDYYSSNKDKIIKISKRQLVTRDGKHRTDIFTYVEGCFFPLLYKKSGE